MKIVLFIISSFSKVILATSRVGGQFDHNQRQLQSTYDTPFAVSTLGPQNQVITLTNGNFVIAWSDNQVFFQVYSNTGGLVGTTTQVGNALPYHQCYVQIAPLQSGFALVFQEQTSSSSWDIYLAVYDSSGNQVSAPTHVTPSCGNFGFHPQISSLSTGDIVYTCDSNTITQASSTGVTTTSASYAISQAMNAPSSKVVGMSSTQVLVVGNPTINSNQEIYGFFLAVPGMSQTSSALISTGSSFIGNDQSSQFAYTLSSGEVIVVWNGKASGLSNSAIWGAVLSNAGTLSVNPTNLISSASFLGYSQFQPAATQLQNGEVVICWTGQNSGSTTQIFFEIMSSDLSSTFVGPTLTSNGTGFSTQNQNECSVSGLSNGDFIVTWHGSDSGPNNVFGARFKSCGNTEECNPSTKQPANQQVSQSVIGQAQTLTQASMLVSVSSPGAVAYGNCIAMLYYLRYLSITYNSELKGFFYTDSYLTVDTVPKLPTDWVNSDLITMSSPNFQYYGFYGLFALNASTYFMVFVGLFVLAWFFGLKCWDKNENETFSGFINLARFVFRWNVTIMFMLMVLPDLLLFSLLEFHSFGDYGWKWEFIFSLFLNIGTIVVIIFFIGYKFPLLIYQRMGEKSAVATNQSFFILHKDLKRKTFMQAGYIVITMLRSIIFVLVLAFFISNPVLQLDIFMMLNLLMMLYMMTIRPFENPIRNFEIIVIEMLLWEVNFLIQQVSVDENDQTSTNAIILLNSWMSDGLLFLSCVHLFTDYFPDSLIKFIYKKCPCLKEPDRFEENVNLANEESKVEQNNKIKGKIVGDIRQTNMKGKFVRKVEDIPVEHDDESSLSNIKGLKMAKSPKSLVSVADLEEEEEDAVALPVFLNLDIQEKSIQKISPSSVEEPYQNNELPSQVGSSNDQIEQIRGKNTNSSITGTNSKAH